MLPPPPKNYKISSAFSYNFRLALTILFIRGEDPVLDQKYDLKRHPNIRLTADGKAKPYIHKPQGAPNYALPDLPYTFKSLDDFDFIDMEETEHEESEQEESLEENEDE